MKKRSFTTLDLNKTSISKLDNVASIVGGTSAPGSTLCTMPTMQCASMTGGSCRPTQWKCP